jgi:hypothetical protein
MVSEGLSGVETGALRALDETNGVTNNNLYSYRYSDSIYKSTSYKKQKQQYMVYNALI